MSAGAEIAHPLATLRRSLPEGRSLTDELWRVRHKGLVALIWAHAVGLPIFGAFRGYGLDHAVLDGIPLALAAAFAGASSLPRAVRSGLAAVGLVASSAMLVHLSGGSIEAHFHFFVMVGLLSLYQEWMPFLLAIGFVVLHHGVLGALMPETVYNHGAAVQNPWRWAVIHGFFVLGASVANLVAWRLNEHQALHDGLTGLPNRVLLADRIGQALVGRGDDRVIGVLFIDVDGFKGVNDSLGHAAGDDLLRQIAQRLTRIVRQGDSCARLGGDEFAILVEDTRGGDAATRIASRALEVIKTPFDVGGRTVEVAASIGIALCAPGRANAEDALRNADMAMYAAKRAGKSRVELYEPAMHAELLRKLQLEQDLRHALEDAEVVLHYQPIVSLADGRITGFEALARWQHPERGLVAPAEFIPLAEDSGLVVPLGTWVIHEAARQLAVWNKGRPHGQRLTVSVNVSARQLQDASLVGSLSSVLADTGVDPSLIVLEITEGTLMRDSWMNVQRLQALHHLGVGLAIDDFGTGYSALSYLRRFPVDILKIDKSFVDDLLGSKEDEALANAVVQLGAAVGLRTIAEGIETAEQAEALRRLGCTMGQGYYFSRPVTADAATDLLGVAALVAQISPVLHLG